ncbi:hypothetical protein LOC67_00020 [Stieleria sp. JC731]|uniref:hypothetical protein n=1 Tax=Pirellulaceae TaxID=2691357 RepID=UPI001E37F5D9|nr:hypothetical protein [Stieleria sp. JC731]MCC9598925.1 hypothetical protein [Stieleria sp. JC731]
MPATSSDQDSPMIPDDEIAVFLTRFPTGVRDFVLHQKISDREYRILNPLELLGTQMAVRVLHALARSSPEQGLHFSLSRLLVQCLEYRGNRRHLIVEPWDLSDLRGDNLFQENRTQFARDCSEVQAERFRLVLSDQALPKQTEDDLYWGTFSTLPHVEDTFDDPVLGKFALEIHTLIVGDEEVESNIDVSEMRSAVQRAWGNYFEDFDIAVPRRQRRDLFKRLMSVAVRQASTLTERIAFAFVLRNAGSEALTRDQEFFSERERRLFDLRYGASEPLGKINIGFLYDYDDLHAELLNELASSLVRENSDSEWLLAEDVLRRHVQLLGELRDLRREVRADERRGTRQSRATRTPLPSIELSIDPQPDERTERPDANLIGEETLEWMRCILDRLKPRDRRRAQALLDANGDRAAAANSLGLSTETFNRQMRQTVRPNLESAMRLVREDEDES